MPLYPVPTPRPARRRAALLAAAVLGAIGLTNALVPVLADAPASASATPAAPADLDRRIRQAAERLEAVVEQHNGVREDLSATKAKAAALAARSAPLHEAVEAHRSRIGSLAAGAYRAGGVRGANTLLAAASPEQFADRLLLVQRLTNEQQRAIDDLAEARERYESMRRALDRLAAEQRAQEARLAERRRVIRTELAKLRRLRLATPGWGWDRPAPATGHPPPFAPGRAGRAVRFAYAQIGKPYGWGAAGPTAYDCSGLTSAAWRVAGVRLPHNAARQWHAVTQISRAELRPGDLVFYYSPIQHVGMYVGGGRIVHAPTFGERVRVERIGYAPILGYGRP